MTRGRKQPRDLPRARRRRNRHRKPLRKSKRTGYSLLLRIHEPAGSGRKKFTISLKIPARRLISKPGLASNLRRLAEVLAACGHPMRLAILRLLLSGATNHGALQAMTKCKAGPLHHHIARLRMSDLIEPKQRDVYELTTTGRRVLLAILSLEKLSRSS